MLPRTYTMSSCNDKIGTTMPVHAPLHASLLRLAVCASVLFAQAAFASSLPAGCDMAEQASFQLTFTEDMRPVAQATINSASVPVMLSIGAPESVVFNKKVLDRLGIPVRNSTTILFTSDARNETGVDIQRDISHALIEEFSFGLLKREHAEYLVEDFADDRFAARVGAGRLLKTDLEIALDAGYLKSFKPNGCFRAHLAYWDPQAVAVPARSDPWQRDPRLVFSMRIDDKVVWALLSTGTPHSYLPKALAARIGLTPASPGASREDPLPGQAPDKPVWKVPVPLMSIGALEVKNLDLRVMDLPHTGDILILGADFLHRYRIYIAREQQQIYFSPVQSARTVKRGSVEVIPQAIH
jgi:predicted aspartyl protease